MASSEGVDQSLRCGVRGGSSGSKSITVQSRDPQTKSDRWGGGVTAEEMHEIAWVNPKVAVQIRFVEWTAEGRLRHAAFVGLRHDKDAKEVRRE